MNTTFYIAHFYARTPRVFSCNLPPAPFGRMTGVFTCYHSTIITATKTTTTKYSKSAGVVPGFSQHESELPFSQHESELPFLRHESELPFSQHESELPFSQHESELPFLQHESELPFLQHESELPFLQHESELPFLQHESELPFLQHESELRNVVRHVKERRETRVMRLETDVSSELPLTSLEPATLAWQMSKLKCSNNRLYTQSSERLSENSALCH